MDIGGWHKAPDARGWLTACLPRPRLSLEDCRKLTECGRRLGELGYTEEAVQGWLGGVSVSGRRFSQAPGYLWRLQKVGTLGAALAGFGLLRESLPLRTAREIFGDALEVLERLRLLERSGERVLPLADLYPCLGIHLFADPKTSWRPASPDRHQVNPPYYRLPNHVYEVGGDSYCLARTTPRYAVEEALDLCTGTGVQALVAGRQARSVRGVDVNPRAVELAEINAVLNGLDLRCRFSQGNLFAPVKGRRFDLVTANTPFVPVPLEERLEAYRAGGETGEDINRRIVEGLTEHLAPGGTFVLYTNYPVNRHSGEVLERIANWLGGGEGWGLAHLHYSTSPRDEYIELQIFDWARDGDPAAYSARFRRWVECYERQAIRGMGEGTIYIRRLAPGHPGFQRTVDLGTYPTEDMSAQVTDWLDALERYTDPSWQPDWDAPLKLHPRVHGLYSEVQGGSGWATFAPGWTFGQELPGAAFTLVRECLEGTAGEASARLGWSRHATRDLAAALGAAMVLEQRPQPRGADR